MEMKLSLIHISIVLGGDISWGINLAEAKGDFALIDSLPGKKIICLLYTSDEPYINETIDVLEHMGDLTYPQTVPEGCVFVMGDNLSLIHILRTISALFRMFCASATHRSTRPD